MTDPLQDEHRLAALADSGLMDSGIEESFDRITRLAARVLRTPVTLVSLVGPDRQFFKSSCGLPPPFNQTRQTPLSHSFCKYVVRANQMLVVRDARIDPEMKTNLAVRELNVVAYMGAPLVTEDGRVLGAFCAIDDKPRDWSEDEQSLLCDFAAMTSSEIRSRLVMRAKIKALAELDHAKRKFKTFIENCPAPTYIKDKDCRMIYLNPAVKMYYPDCHLWIGKTNEEIFPGEIGRVLSEADRRILSGDRVEMLEESIPFSNGQNAYWLTYKFPVRDDDGSVMLAGMSINITDRHEMEEQLRQAKESADAANRAKGQFLAHMSHEIRTPLTAILGYADLLRDAALPSRNREEFAGTIRRNGEHLLAVISDILDLSKIEAGAMRLEMMATDIRQMLSNVVGLLSQRATDKGLSLKLDVEAEAPDQIRTDPTRLQQIFLNLIGNAIKFTQKGSVAIRVCVDRATGELVTQIRDTGIGLTEEQQSQLFVPFKQADASYARLYGGTGLGLAISSRLAKMLGGRISVQSQLGQGSCFTVHLPLQDVLVSPGDDEKRLPQRSSVAVVSGHGLGTSLNHRVLLAEDCPDNRRLLMLYLSRLGLQVDGAETGVEAVSLMRSAMQGCGSPYELVLMDCQMPEMDGFTATRLLREMGYRGPVVAVTANAMSEDQDRCMAAGCDAYITKPVDREAFVEMVRTYLATVSIG